MLSGRKLDLLDPSPADVELEDVAHGLARVARWNGQTIGAHVFSVAQHSLLVEALVTTIEPRSDPTELLAALLHDAAEYVIGDLISPLKAVVGDGYGALERRLMCAIRGRFGLGEPSAEFGARLKQADAMAAFLEATRLAGFSGAEASMLFGEWTFASVPEAFLDPWPTADAQLRFQERVRVHWHMPARRVPAGLSA